MDAASFDDFVRAATRGPEAPGGFTPYDYQERLARDGLPSLLNVPTGSGKTQAVVLAWLYRRCRHPDVDIRASTPRRLVYVLPMRVLVEQAYDMTRGWLTNLGLTADVGLYLLRGGDGAVDGSWRERCDQDAVIIGTLDMVLSRALHRGYAMSRNAYTVDFGLLNNDVQYVVDEVQLFGPALATTRQLDGLRRKLGTTAPCETTWMSATIDVPALATVDNPGIGTQVTLSPADRDGPMRRRLQGKRTVRQLPVPDDAGRYAATIADHLRDRHRPGTLTLAVLNTVRAAREISNLLRSRTDVPVTTLHSRFRPPDRRDRLSEVLAADQRNGPGRIVVATQVLEAGVDVSSAVMLTEAASWPSLVQRAGRCNRDAAVEEAELWWTVPRSSAPYSDADVTATVAALSARDGSTVTSSELGTMAVAVEEVTHPTLRRRDLLELFDTTPDLSGNDVDISRYLRDADDLDVQLAWRSLPTAGPTPEMTAPVAEELCPAPVGEVRAAVKTGRGAWVYDPHGRWWKPCKVQDVRPGAVVLLCAEEGGYLPLTGWDPRATEFVPPTPTAEPDPLTQPAQAYDDEPGTVRPRAWISLRQHLADVGAEAERLLGLLASEELSQPLRAAVIAAGRLHSSARLTPSGRTPSSAKPPRRTVNSVMLVGPGPSRTPTAGWSTRARAFGTSSSPRCCSSRPTCSLALRNPNLSAISSPLTTGGCGLGCVQARASRRGRSSV